MSRLYDTLRRMEREKHHSGAATRDSPAEILSNIVPASAEKRAGPSANIRANDAGRLVALTDPKSLGAEKFRALVARLQNLREKTELRSLQVTSAVINEGKSLVSANLALTLVKHFGYKVLLVEGDLHRPTLTTLLGLSGLTGINEWWLSREDDQEVYQSIYKLGDMDLWFLSAGSRCDQPANILQSARFAEMFIHQVAAF